MKVQEECLLSVSFPNLFAVKQTGYVKSRTSIYLMFFLVNSLSLKRKLFLIIQGIRQHKKVVNIDPLTLIVFNHFSFVNV